jgi:type IV pilus assembly protein PilC
MVGLATDSEARVLFHDAVRFLVESLGAEGAMALYGRQRMEVQSSRNLKRNKLRGEAILNQVSSEGTPLLGKNSSILCVPLIEPGSKRVRGILYAERRDPRRPFTQHHFSRLMDFVRNLEGCLFRPSAGSNSTLAFERSRAAAKKKRETESKPASRVAPAPKLIKRRLQPRSLTVFFRSLATMVESGITLHRAVGLLGASGGDAGLEQACDHMEQNLHAGKPLSVSMQGAGVFNDFQTQLVRTGERSGTLASVLGHLAHHQEKTENTIMKVRSALTYPAIIFVVALAALILAPPFLLRGQLEMIKQSGAELPFVTKVLILISDLLLSPYFWVIAVAGVTLAITSFIRASQTVRGRRAMQSALYGLPVVGKAFKVFATTRFARSLAIQLKTGILWTEALPQSAASSGSVVLAERVAVSVKSLREGRTPSESLGDAHFFPSLLIELVQVGQETGSPAKMMDWVADFYDSELEAALGRMVALLEPLIMLGMGVMVGFILVATLLPMVSVLNLL